MKKSINVYKHKKNRDKDIIIVIVSHLYRIGGYNFGRIGNQFVGESWRLHYRYAL